MRALFGQADTARAMCAGRCTAVLNAKISQIQTFMHRILFVIFGLVLEPQIAEVGDDEQNDAGNVRADACEREGVRRTHLGW